MTVSEAPIDLQREQAFQARNLTDTAVLAGGMGLLLALSAFLLWGWIGTAVALAAVAGLYQLAPRVPPELVMRLYRAQPVDPANGQQLYDILEALVARTDLARAPRLYVVPSLTLNAFSVGQAGNAAIALTEGLLRKLSLREITGVLAHELSHVRNEDLRILGLADIVSRLMQVMSWVALGLALYHLPAALSGGARIPWLGIGLLYLGPMASSLLQLALSRTREFDADLDAAALTGDPAGLAGALAKIERQDGQLWEDLVFPGARRTPQPSLLRSHPRTEDRIARLSAITQVPNRPPVIPREVPMVSLVGFGPVMMRPRYRLPGIWF